MGPQRAADRGLTRRLPSAFRDCYPIYLLFPWRRKYLAPCASSLEREIDRAFPDWSCAVTDAPVNRDHLPGQEFDSSIVEINKEAAFQ